MFFLKCMKEAQTFLAIYQIYLKQSFFGGGKFSTN